MVQVADIRNGSRSLLPFQLKCGFSTRPRRKTLLVRGVAQEIGITASVSITLFRVRFSMCRDTNAPVVMIKKKMKYG